jgi:hypothetical protein
MTHGPKKIVDLIEESGWSYPVTTTRLERKHALTNIRIDERGNSMMLGELLAKGDIDRFEDEDDLYVKLEPLFEAERRERNVGIIAKLKQIVLGTYTR